MLPNVLLALLFGPSEPIHDEFGDVAVLCCVHEPSGVGVGWTQVLTDGDEEKCMYAYIASPHYCLRVSYQLLTVRAKLPLFQEACYRLTGIARLNHLVFLVDSVRPKGVG